MEQIELMREFENAIRANNPHEVASIIPLLADINSTCVDHDTTPFIVACVEACKTGDLTISRLLHDAGADINIKQSNQHPLDAVCLTNEPFLPLVVKWLLDNGTNVNTGAPIECLCSLPESDFTLSALTLLLNAGADVNRNAPLFEATRVFNPKTIRILVIKGATITPDVVSIVCERSTEPDFQFKQQNETIARLLVRHGATPSQCHAHDCWCGDSSTCVFDKICGTKTQRVNTW